MRIAAIFLSIAVISILLGGYQFGVKDQYVTIPIYLRHLDPTLYPNDYYYPQPNESRSMYAPFLALSYPFFPDIPTQFFILYSLFHTLWLYALYRLALVLLKDQKQALFSLLFFITPKWVAGTGAMTYELSLVYRTMAMPLALLAFVWVLEKRLMPAAFALLAALVIHPLTALYVGFPAYLILGKQVIEKYKLRSALYIPVIFLPLLVLFSLPYLLKTPLILDPQWLTIIRQRLPFAVLSRWDVLDWGNVGFFAILGASVWIFKRTLVSCNQHVLRAVGIATAAAFVVPALGEIFSIAPLIQVQFARSLTLTVVLILILFSSVLYSLCTRPHRLGIGTLLALISVSYPIPQLATAVALVLLLLFIPQVRSHIDRGRAATRRIRPVLFFALTLALHALLLAIGYRRDPDPHWLLKADTNNPWIQVQRWAKEYTVKDALFLTNPYHSGFRVFSERSPVVEYKDGTASIFSREKGLVWRDRLEKAQDAETLTIEHIRSLQQTLHFDYIVRSRQSSALSLPPIYQNADYIVYRL